MTRINTRPRSTPATLADAELEETIQALSNVHLKPPGNWHAPSLAPRQKRNSSDYLSHWVACSVANYQTLVTMMLGRHPSNQDLLWLTQNAPGESLALRFDDVADYYSIGRYHGAIDQAHRYAKENAASIRGWNNRPATPYKPPLPLPVCPRCNRDMKRLNGKYGEFWGCLPCYHNRRRAHHFPLA